MNTRWKIILAISIIALLSTGCSQSTSTEGDGVLSGDELFHQTLIGQNQVPGCAACHATEPDKVGIGPSLAGYSSWSEAELREAIFNPAAEIAEGYSNVMYANYGTDLTEDELNSLIDYIKTLN